MATIGALAIKITASAKSLLGALAASAGALKTTAAAAENASNRRKTADAAIGKSARDLAKLQKDLDRDALRDVLEQQRAREHLYKAWTGLAKTAIKSAVGGVVDLASWLANLVVKAAEASTESLKLSRSLGATYQGVVSLQLAVRSLGGDQDAVGKGLAALNRRLVDAASGSKVAGDIFKRLGLDAHELAKLHVDKAFARIADKIAAIPDPGRRAAFAVQIFGESAKDLLPILYQGAKGMDRATESAKQLGFGITEIDASQIEVAQLQVHQLQERLTGAATAIAGGLAPWVSALLDQFGDLGIDGPAAAKLIVDGMRVVGKVVAGVIDVGTALMQVWRRLEIGFYRFTQGVNVALREIFDVLSHLPDLVGGDDFAEWSARAGRAADHAARKAEMVGKTIEDINKAASASSQVDKFFDDLGTRVAAAGERTARINTQIQTAGGSLQEAAKKAHLFEEGLKVFEEVKMPLQKFDETLARLDALLESGSISWDTYAKSVARAADELERAHQLNELKNPNAVRANTAEAASAITQFQQLQDRRLRETPEQRVERIQQQSLEIEKQQLEQQKKVAKALTDPPKVVKF